MLANRPKGISINRNALNIQANHDNINIKNQLPANGPQRTPSPPPLKSSALFQQQQLLKQPSENDGAFVAPIITKLQPAPSRIPRLVEEEIEDIDKSTSRDAVLLVCDVAKDIFNYMFKQEEVYQIKQDYLREQKVFTPRVRQRLINWLIEIYAQSKLNLLQETLYLAISLIDQYFQKVTVKHQSQVQLVAIGATMIASKYEEIYPPEMNDLIRLTQNAYTRRDVMRIEIEILEQLDFNLGRPIPLAFLRRFSKAAHCDLKMHSISKFLMEISLTEYECSHWKPSLLAAAALFTTIHLVNHSSASSLMDMDKTYNSNTSTTSTSSIAGFGLSRRLALSSSSANSRSSAQKASPSPIINDRWNRTLAHYSHYTRAQLLEPSATLCRILKRVLASPQSYSSAQKIISSLSVWYELKSSRVDELIKLAEQQVKN